MFDLEVKNAALNQYSRRNNIEIGGIPESIKDYDLQHLVIQILGRINVRVDQRDIEGCHRLFKHPNYKGPAKVIIRFVNRKAAFKALANKKNLLNLNFMDIGLGTANLYICENLCPAYRLIYDTALKLLKQKVIRHLWTFKGVVHLRISENDHDIWSFTHIDNLYRQFPN